MNVLDIDRCFQRVLPGVIATCDRGGIPNINYVTQIQVIDERHIALSYQFPTKTRLNLEENPRATLEVYDPLTLDAYRLDLRFDHVETEGPLFERLAMRIEAIASHTGLAKVFRLRAAYVCEVLAIEQRDGFLDGPPPRKSALELYDEPMTEMRGLRLISERISRAQTLDELLTGALAALDEVYGFTHGTILVPDGDRLVTIASHGYAGATVGAEVAIGDGLIGVVAKTREPLRVLGLDHSLSYSRSLRPHVARTVPNAQLSAEVPLPGLPDARSQLAIPLVVQDRLLGVIALEARDMATFSQFHESFLGVLANQIASAMEAMTEDDGGEAAEPATRHELVYFKNDDCVFVDGEYLIRNVPAKILWKLLDAHEREGRTEFSNRELRLDPRLGLPAIKDNLESRLILLRKRLAEKIPELRLVPTRRGHFALEIDCKLDLVERETA
jgi:putative methionine-R-sulfoxide reductase with GAF domain